MSNDRIFIAGAGYIGMRIGVREVTRGARVTASTRSRERFSELHNRGLHPIAYQAGADPAELAAHVEGAIIYYLIPPSPSGTEDLHARHFVAASGSARPRSVVLISTTGVYGDTQGDWIDESARVQPSTDRGRRRAHCEATFRQWCDPLAVPLTILRVAGIYGPGKLPLERLRRGDPVVDPAEAPYSNRIHAEDLVRACLAAARRDGACRVYNAADGTPGNISDYLLRVADKMDLPRPTTIPLAEALASASEAMRGYLRESRRIDSTRMREELLDGRLLYPDLESGLRSLGGASESARRPTLVVCINRRMSDDKPSCAARGGDLIAQRLQQAIEADALPLDLKTAYCLGHCEQGPHVRLVPRGLRWSGVQPSEVPELLLEIREAIDSD